MLSLTIPRFLPDLASLVARGFSSFRSLRAKFLALMAIGLLYVFSSPHLAQAQSFVEDPAIQSLMLLDTSLGVDSSACSVSEAENKAKDSLSLLCGRGYRVENVVCDICSVVRDPLCFRGQGVSCSCTGDCVRIPPTPTPTPKPKSEPIQNGLADS